MILDIFSRYVVGWMLTHRESEHLAERLIRETVMKQGIVREQLTIHSDRGPSMRSQTVAQLLATLGITKSHNIDPKQVYATGMSNGGMMCYRLAAELSDRIAAVAPVAGTMAIEKPIPSGPFR
ncbi:MAG: DDE-type integrase/transposase/recombinase [Pirellulales bacterium]|nr:DDE-type integrase/transposase/recombinase [Pirellulales bacterium]